jgi:hypothetical protein
MPPGDDKGDPPLRPGLWWSGDGATPAIDHGAARPPGVQSVSQPVNVHVVAACGDGQNLVPHADTTAVSPQGQPKRHIELFGGRRRLFLSGMHRFVRQQTGNSHSEGSRRQGLNSSSGANAPTIGLSGSMILVLRAT